eukprot:2741345-Rhodomonas_salina.1
MAECSLFKQAASLCLSAHGSNCMCVSECSLLTLHRCVCKPSLLDSRRSAAEPTRCEEDGRSGG